MNMSPSSERVVRTPCDPHILTSRIDIGISVRRWGIGKVDLNGCFCAHFLLSVEDGNHDVPEHLALFVHNLCCMVRKHSDHVVEPDDIGFIIDCSFVCGYPQSRTDSSGLCLSGRGPFPSCCRPICIGQFITRPMR